MADFTDNYEYYKTDKGVIVPDTSNVLSGVQSEFAELFGLDFNTDPETPQGRIIEMITRSRVFTLQMAAACSNMLNLNRANGFVLDDLGSLFYLERGVATYTEGTVGLNGVPGTTVPLGTRLQNTNGDIFVLTGEAPYEIGSGGSVTATYRAEQTGPILCLAGTLTTILDRVIGLETVNNAANQSVIGSNLESDASFRERIKNSQQKNAISVIGAIKAAVANVPGVDSVKVLENDSTSSVVSAGITIPAHGFAVVVDGGNNQAIAEAIFNKKTLGASYPSGVASGLTLVTATVSDGDDDFEVKFVRPEDVAISIDITVKRQDYTGSDLEGDIKQAILNMALGLNEEVDGWKIGSEVSVYEIGAAVSSAIPEIFIKEVTATGMGGGITQSQKPVVTANDITVVIE